MNTAVSYRYCHQLTRRTARNFYPAFLTLPRLQRRAMEALYAFMRITDDLADEVGEPEKKQFALTVWRDQLHAAMNNEFVHAIHPALADTIRRWDIPVRYLELVIEGVEQDLHPVQICTFEELRGYCHRVASAVGLACVHIWGFRDPMALKFAESAGIAFQLTNILRDLAEDLANGRVYLPESEWMLWGCPPEGWSADNEKFRTFLRFQIDRTKGYYSEGRRLRPFLFPAGRAIFSAMIDTYEDLLLEIEHRNGDLFRERTRVPTWRKAAWLAGAFPRRWGWR
ncbi:phytoene/squalene synthase family protein [Zavarzinella formosa]|uniref:phytoene/squalene synthase family protein n=1 Tax=Zavarzinella formosa TaxID=360055 RepID=UPI0002F9AD5A|nr:phytoene/squalene synthase family protein [Zavarzinella formosa]